VSVSWPPPPPRQVWEAIGAYLDVAYSTGLPSAVRARLETLHSIPEEEFYECAVFEHENVRHPTRFSIRLGSWFYPHMKLVIDRAPNGHGWIFRADTHDQHVCPDPKSRDYTAFCRLMEQNQKLSQAVEAEWEKRGLATFKTYLRQDLARRKRPA
jgi:hypothetical protein